MKAKTSRKSDTLIVLMITGDSGGKKETLSGPRTRVIVRTKLTSIAQVAQRGQNAKFYSLAYLMTKNTLKESFERLNITLSPYIDRETKKSYNPNWISY
jgi:hypothetical protein